MGNSSPRDERKRRAQQRERFSYSNIRYASFATIWQIEKIWYSVALLSGIALMQTDLCALPRVTVNICYWPITKTQTFQHDASFTEINRDYWIDCIIVQQYILFHSTKIQIMEVVFVHLSVIIMKEMRLNKLA
jgi:hypothetical protein